MLSLASVRYRNALAVDGGPVEGIETGALSVRGRRIIMANARLVSGLIRKSPVALYSDADGTGTDRVVSIARHKAVSEALERWAFHATVRSERAAEFGFDIDPSTTGMSAFPGMLRRQARRTSVLEAIERFSMCAWWDGRVAGHRFETDWPGVSAIAIDGPFGGVTVIAYALSEWGGYAYGHAAEESFGAACEKAVVELARHELLLKANWLAAVAGDPIRPAHLFEKRCLFFSSDEGHALFQERLASRPEHPPARVEVICDSDIPGPWDEFATVWRFALRPPSDGYLRGGERYFFL